MRRFPLVGIVAMVTVAFVACVGRGTPAAVCSPASRPPSGTTLVATNRSVLGITEPWDGSGGAVLARRDPLSLQPVSPQVPIDEYHDAWSLSPDGSQVALAVSAPGREGRIGVLLVDLDTMKVVRGIETGIAAEALGWLAPRVLIAALQRGGTVRIDPVTGTTTNRWPDFSFPDESARTRDSLVMLAGPDADPSPGGAPALLAVVDARDGLRSVVLEPIRLRVRVAYGTVYRDRAGLAVDPERKRAYVFAAGAPVAEVDLSTLHVTYHPEPSTEVRRRPDVLVQERDAFWLGDRQVLVVGQDILRPKSDQPERDEAVVDSTAAGASLVNTADWGSCVLDAQADGATSVTPGLLLVYSEAQSGIGLRAYTIAGHRTFHLFDGEQMLDLDVADGRAYIQTDRARRVVDTTTGEVLSTIVANPQITDLIAVSS